MSELKTLRCDFCKSQIQGSREDNLFLAIGIIKTHTGQLEIAMDTANAPFHLCFRCCHNLREILNP